MSDKDDGEEDPFAGMEKDDDKLNTRRMKPTIQKTYKELCIVHVHLV